MTLQTTVNYEQALGIVGDLVDSSPARVETMKLTPVSGGKNEIGHAYTAGSYDFTAVEGGTGDFAGVLINSKEHGLIGDVGTPNQNVPVYGAICSLGRVYVSVPEAVVPGYVAAFDQATGIIHAYANEAAIPASGYTYIPGKFADVSATTNGVAILEITTPATINITIEEAGQ